MEVDSTSGPSKIAKVEPKGIEPCRIKDYLNPSALEEARKILAKRKEIAIVSLLKQLPGLGDHFDCYEKLGEGSFSSVYLARAKHSQGNQRSNSTRTEYAIKHFKPVVPFQAIDKETKILQLVGGGDNVVAFKFCVMKGNCSIIAMQYHAHDKFNDYVTDMDVQETQLYLYNLMIALRRVHSYGVIHRDIKPSNFLYKRETKSFMLVDFGVSTHVQGIGKNVCGAGTRGFQAPEVLLRINCQSAAVDMWSAGVIFMTIISKKYPFFIPLQSEDLFELIKIFGSEKIMLLATAYGLNVPCYEKRPPLNISKLCERLRRFRDIKSESALVNFHTLPNCPHCTHPIDEEYDGCLCLTSAIRSNVKNVFPPCAYDLLEKLLDVDPFTRISADDALKHPFLKKD